MYLQFPKNLPLNSFCVLVNSDLLLVCRSTFWVSCTKTFTFCFLTFLLLLIVLLVLLPPLSSMYFIFFPSFILFLPLLYFQFFTVPLSLVSFPVSSVLSASFFFSFFSHAPKYIECLQALSDLYFSSFGRDQRKRKDVLLVSCLYWLITSKSEE